MGLPVGQLLFGPILFHTPFLCWRGLFSWGLGGDEDIQATAARRQDTVLDSTGGGLLFFTCSIYDTINSVRAAGRNWQFMPLEGTAAAMGLYLILLALSAQNKPVASRESADPDCGGGELPS
jgi:hypothetical protein